MDLKDEAVDLNNFLEEDLFPISKPITINRDKLNDSIILTKISDENSDLFIQFIDSDDKKSLLREEKHQNAIFQIISAGSIDDCKFLCGLIQMINDICRRNTLLWDELSKKENYDVLIAKILEYNNFSVDMINFLPVTLENLDIKLMESIKYQKKIFLDHLNTNDGTENPQNQTTKSNNINQLTQFNDSAGILATSMLVYILSRNYKNFDGKLIYVALNNYENLFSDLGRITILAKSLGIQILRSRLLNFVDFTDLLLKYMVSTNNDLCYYSLICLWLITYDKKLIEEGGPLQKKSQLIECWIENAINACKREKIVRVGCMVILNFENTKWALEMLLERNVDNTIKILEYEKWRDKELYELIQQAYSVLKSGESQISNKEKYLKELDKGILVPGSTHTEIFWTKNVNLFEDNEFKIVKILSEIIQNSQDPTTLSLAIFDIGEFSRLYPNSRVILEKTRVKIAILNFLNHSNKAVSREALLATQKIMLNYWKK